MVMALAMEEQDQGECLRLTSEERSPAWIFATDMTQEQRKKKFDEVRGVFLRRKPLETAIPVRGAETCATVASLTSGRTDQELAAILQVSCATLVSGGGRMPSMQVRSGPPEIETAPAETLRVRFCRAHQMTTGSTIENSARAARQLRHQPEFIALNAIRTAYWITLPACF